jgi:hypothetical protein
MVHIRINPHDAFDQRNRVATVMIDYDKTVVFYIVDDLLQIAAGKLFAQFGRKESGSRFGNYYAVRTVGFESSDVFRNKRRNLLQGCFDHFRF